jgi:hypothetical protein
MTLPRYPRLHRHHLWLERPLFLALLQKRWLVLCASLVLYCTGLLVAAVFSVPTLYLSSPAFIVGAGGVGWVLGSIRDRGRRIDEIYADLHEIFSIDQVLYYVHVERYFGWFCRIWPQLICSGVIGVFNILAAWIAFYGYPLVVLGQVQGSTRPWLFAPAIYETPARDVYFCIVVYYALLISIMLGSSVWLIFGELVLVRSLPRLPIVPVANAVRARLRVLANFHVQSAIDWSLGAVMFFVLFAATPDLISVTIIAMVILIGVAVLAIPQYYLMNLVRLAHEKVCAILIQHYNEVARANTQTAQTAGFFADLVAATERHPYWVYSAEELTRWTAAQLTAVAALVIQILSLKR